MSSKNLAKTAIDSGHYSGKNQRKNGHNHPKRRTARREEREAVKEFFVSGDDCWDVFVQEPCRKTRQSDSLGAVKRWILAQCDRPWNDVYSDICKKFNSQTMAGRHILSHIEGFVSLPEKHFNYILSPRQYPDSNDMLYLDENRVLRKNKNYRGFCGTKSKFQMQHDLMLAKRKEIKNWMNERYIRSEGALLFWAKNIIKTIQRVWSCDKNKWVTSETFSFERCEKFSKSDMKFYFGLEKESRPKISIERESVQSYHPCDLRSYHSQEDMFGRYCEWQYTEIRLSDLKIP